MDKEFNENEIFYYNHKRKIIEGMLIILSVLFVVLVMGVYFLYLKEKKYWWLAFIERGAEDLYTQIKSFSLQGAFIVALVGGLFFVVVPTEIIFIRFMFSLPSFLLLIVYVFGLFLSYNVDYYIGKKLGGLAKRLVGAKKFYSIKGMLNNRGGWAVFLFNLVPFLPSQALTTILGVFNYPRLRFYLFFFLGQVLKYFAIIMFYKWVI